MYSSWDGLEYLSLVADLSWKAAGGERFREYGGWTVRRDSNPCQQCGKLFREPYKVFWLSDQHITAIARKKFMGDFSISDITKLIEVSCYCR